MRKMGTKLTSGPGVSTIPPQPSWNTITVTPKAAPTESKKPIPAVMGTITERKIISSNNTARPTTTLKYSGIAPLSRSVMSISMGTRPVTPVNKPVACSICTC